MSYSSFEGRLLEVFSHLGMIKKDSSKENEEALMDLVVDIPKARLTKDVCQLTESFLAMQSLSPANALSYLSYVTGTLFELVSHPDPDVRMAADEGINQIVKLADIQLVQHVICEVFLEIKRSLHARSLTSALRKFSASIGRINPKKRRIYAVNILPVLSGLINREEEMVWECFAETIEPIAIFIFPHTSQQELITLLLKGLLEKLESEKNYIRRSAATILASSVVHSRLPHELSYLLIQQLISRISVLKQRFLFKDSKTSSSSAAGLQGCLWGLRNIASLYSRIPTSALVKGQLKSIGRPLPTEYLSAPLVALDALGTAKDFFSWARESLEFFWWSVVRLICLQLACRNYQTAKNASSYVMVCTASLECLLEVLSSTPAGSTPTELPNDFQSTLRAFCGVKRLPSTSSLLHLDGYDSSFEASDADDGSSVASQSLNLSSSRVVEREGETVSLVKRNLLPITSNKTNQIDKESVALDDPSSPSIEMSDETDSEDESGIFATSSMHGCLGLFAERFGLIPGTKISARASAQSLAVACLAKLTLTLPPKVFFEPLRHEDGSKESCTGVDVALHLTHHSDPQVRGNACLLIGNLLRSTVTHALADQSLKLDFHLRNEIFRLMSSLDDLLTSEKSGITFRMGLKAMRYCANAVLHLPALVDQVTMEKHQPDASIRLVECLSSHLVDCARHSYRLVRRETMLFICDLDWDQFEHLERVWFGLHRKGVLKRLVTATPLSTIAWNECLRLFADADRSLGKEAFRALLALAKKTPSVDFKGTVLNSVGLESLDIGAASLFDHSALTGQSPVSSELPLIQDEVISDVSSFFDDLRSVAKDLPVDLRFSAVPTIPLGHSPKSLIPNKRDRRRRWKNQIIGIHRLFRELVDSLLELSPVCDTAENRSMMNSIISGLAELVGRAPITLYHYLWYSPSPIPRSFDIDNDPDNAGIPPARLALQHYQRRPKMALLLWHCISQLSISPLALTDLELQTQLLILASGCALRWGVSSLMEGSIVAGGTMELHPEHAFTRASGALLTHVIRLLAIFWHVFKDVKPSASSSASAILSNLPGGAGANSAVPIAVAPIGVSSANVSPVVMTTTNQSGNQAKSKSIFGIQFIQTTETEEEESKLVIGSRETRGFFADSMEYMQLYTTIKASFETYKSSFADHATRDRTIDLLGSTLNAFSRLTEVLRFAEVVSWVEEVLVYLEAAFTWAPNLVLNAAINLLRALFGTNLSSIWNTELSSKFHAVFDFETPATSETDSLDEHIRQLCNTHFENAAQIRFCNAIGRSFLDWMNSARQSHQPAMLRPESLPANIQQPNLAYYIRLFEPLVLQSIHQYHLHTEAAVQAKILQILTVLIELGVNYAQLDEEFRFLKTLMAQCESLQHSNATASYNHQTSSKNVSELVSSLFKFFIVLTYERKSSASSTLEAKTVLTLSEVVHLAEVLAAGGVDVDSFVVPALAPLIIDIYVRRGARYHSALRINVLNSPQEKLSDLNAQLLKDLHDWTAHREVMLRFLLPKFIQYPKTFDFLCVALEDASLTDTVLKVTFESGESSLAYRNATEILGHFLSGLADCSLILDCCGDVDACLRLVKRLASPPWPTATVHDVILHQIILILYKQRSEETSFKQSLQQLQRWMSCKLVCLRFLLLLALKQPSNLLPALRDFGNCGQSDPRAVLFDHLLDYLTTISEAILDHLSSSLDDIFVSSTESRSTTFLGQLLLAFQLDILTLSRLHAFSTAGIPIEKIQHLDAILSTYGRFKPLVPILWHQLRAEFFQIPVENYIQLTSYHRNCVCVRRVTFLLRSRIKNNGYTNPPDIDLLDTMKLSELNDLILSVGDTKQRLELLKKIISTTVLRFETAVAPSYALPQVKILRVLSLIISNLIDQEWEIDNLKSLLLDLTASFEKWLDIKPRNLLFGLPAIRKELEFVLINCLLGVENLKLDEFPEHLETFLTSLDPSKTSRIFFTAELPKALTKMLNRLSKNVFKQETPSLSAKDMIAASLSNALNVCCKDGGRLAARLIQSNPHFELATDLPPRFLQHVIRLAFVASMKRFSSDASGAFEADPLWEEGKEILFKKLSVLNEIQNEMDPIKQRQLVGLAAATIDFLILSTRLPLPSASTDEEIETMRALLQKLMQIFIRIINGDSDAPLLNTFDLPLLTLRLAIVLISSTNGKIQDFAEFPLETFVQFAETLDIAASLSEPRTLVPCRTSHSDDPIIHRLRGLLVPKQPGIFRGSINAYTLTRFTEVLNSFAANAGAAGGAGGGIGDGHERSRVALASVFGLCRLCSLGGLYTNALGMGSTELSTQFSAFLISLCRRRDILLTLRQPSAFSDTADIGQIHDSDQNGSTSNGILQWNPDRVAEMDRDALAEASTWLLSLGWLDKTMFESTWTALLAICTPPQPSSLSRSSSSEDEDNPFLNSKEEQVEENHCRVLGINALTRLLLNAAHRPKPGDPMNSSPTHQPRLSMPPQFMHTQIGGRISHVMGCLDQETRSWFCDIPPTRGVIGYDAGNSEGSLSWLSTNLDLGHPADLDSPANQVPIECLVKWMVHSPEPASFEADTIISCLQSLGLVHHAWLRPFEDHILSRVSETINTSTSSLNTTSQKSNSIGSRLSAITSPQALQRNKFTQLFKRGSKIISPGGQGDSLNRLPLAFGDSILLTGVLSPGEKVELPLTDIPKAESVSLDGSVEIALQETESVFRSRGECVVPSLAVLTAVVKSAVLCSDLFTTRGQFLWLIGCLQAVYQSLPRIEEEGCDFSTAPIYTWLTTGLARCTAVLEATMLPASTDIDISSFSDDPTTQTDHLRSSTTQAPQQHHSAPILLVNNLQAAVSIVAGAIGSTKSVALQDAGLRGAMDILQAALLLRATRHPALQQPALVNNPPTGSAMLNMLLLQVCLYLGNRLENLFESEVVLHKRWTETKDVPANLLRIGSTNAGSGMSKITASLVRNASVNIGSSNISARGANATLSRAADVTFKRRSPSEWAAERTSSHQCTVLATAFFIVEQFSPLAGSESTAISRMIIKLTDQLIQLAGTMLHDVQRDFTPPARLSLVFKSRFSETQASLVCADCVINSWVRGMQRLLLSGLISRDDCEALAKQATDRLINSNSNSLRLSSLNLLTTALYTLNAADFLARVSPDHPNGDSERQIDPDAILNSSTEYFTAMWQCLRGGNLLIVSSNSNSPYATPRVNPLEARCISLSLGSLLEDLGRCFLGLVSTNPTALGSLVNKAVSEVARRSGEQDGYLRLITSVLRELVMTLKRSSRKGGEVVQEWVLLALPSLLQQGIQEDQKGTSLRCHGYWVAAVCIILGNLNSPSTNSILNICMANLPLTDGCQQRETKRCQDLLLAACRSIPPADVFRGRLLEIIQKVGGSTALHKAFSES